MVSECLYYGTEVVVAQYHYLFMPLVHPAHGLCRRDFLIENPSEFHRKGVCRFQYRVVLEQYVDAMALYVGPLVLRHHQRVFAPGQYLAHGLTVGVCRHRGTDLSRALSFRRSAAAVCRHVSHQPPHCKPAVRGNGR